MPYSPRDNDGDTPDDNRQNEGFSNPETNPSRSIGEEALGEENQSSTGYLRDLLRYYLDCFHAEEENARRISRIREGGLNKLGGSLVLFMLQLTIAERRGVLAMIPSYVLGSACAFLLIFWMRALWLLITAPVDDHLRPRHASKNLLTSPEEIESLIQKATEKDERVFPELIQNYALAHHELYHLNVEAAEKVGNGRQWLGMSVIIMLLFLGVIFFWALGDDSHKASSPNADSNPLSSKELLR